MKTCSSCRRLLPLEDFHRHRGRSDGRQTVCKTCKRVSNAAYYRADPERHAEARRAARQALRARVDATIEAAKDVPCVDCGGRYPPELMDLDHVRGRKRTDATGMRRLGLAAVKAEIAKCDPVCVRCHRVRTRRRRQRRKVIARYGWHVAR